MAVIVDCVTGSYRLDADWHRRLRVRLLPPNVEQLLAQYFFHIQSDAYHADKVGLEIGNGADARVQAIITCAQLVKDDPQTFWDSRPWTVTVANADGLVLWHLSVDGFSSPAAEALG